MVENQVAAMPDIPDAIKASHAWGLGWQLKTRASSSNFGDLVSARTFGHGGATGTVVWADPDLEMTCAVFTTEPGSGRRLGRVSTAVAGSAT
jgi:CubicO group peptidase (beta-lactamase class C family)